MTTPTEHDTFQEMIHHISAAADAAHRFGVLRNDMRWQAISAGLLEMKERLYKLSESIAVTRQ